MMTAQGTANAGLRPLALLVAEDNVINRKVVERLLAKHGHTVTAVADGAAAVDAVRSQSFDAVLMDLYMPVMDGLEAARAIRALGDGKAHIPIVALTGAATPEELDSCRQAGMDEIAAKPVDTAQLFSVLARLLGSPRPQDRGPPAFDPAMLDMLAQDLGDAETRELALLFRDSGSDLVQRIAAAGAAGTATALQDAAHEMKSASAGLGLMRLSQLCQTVELAAREGRIDPVWSRIQTEFSQGVEAMLCHWKDRG